MPEIYKPHRDRRFEYVWEAISFIERNQCVTCKFSKIGDEDWPDQEHANEYPMCGQIEGEFITEVPIPAIEDRGDDGLFCTIYVQKTT